MLLHASCVALANQGVIITGVSGTGKTSLALSLIDGGASLVADDQVRLELHPGSIAASPPEKLAGLIEIHGVGIIRMPFCSRINLDLCVELISDTNNLERLPNHGPIFLLDHPVRRLTLKARSSLNVTIIRTALAYPLIET